MMTKVGAAAGVRPAVALVQAVVLGAEGVGGATPQGGGQLGGLEEGLVTGVVLRCSMLCYGLLGGSMLCCGLLVSVLLGGSVQQTLLSKTHACSQGKQSSKTLLMKEMLLEKRKTGGEHKANAA